MTAEFALDRWHRWKRTGWTRAPRRRKTAKQLEARDQPRMEDETEESFATGQARYKLPIHPRPQWCSAVRYGNRARRSTKNAEKGERDRDENGAADRIADAEVIRTAR